MTQDPLGRLIWVYLILNKVKNWDLSQVMWFVAPLLRSKKNYLFDFLAHHFQDVEPD